MDIPVGGRDGHGFGSLASAAKDTSKATAVGSIATIWSRLTGAAGLDHARGLISLHRNPSPKPQGISDEKGHYDQSH